MLGINIDMNTNTTIIKQCIDGLSTEGNVVNQCNNNIHSVLLPSITLPLLRSLLYLSFIITIIITIIIFWFIFKKGTTYYTP
jgi:hypothetical protein